LAFAILFIVIDDRLDYKPPARNTEES